MELKLSFIVVEARIVFGQCTVNDEPNPLEGGIME